MYNIFNIIYNLILFKIFKININGNIKTRGRLFIRNHGKISFGNSIKINSGYKYNPIGGSNITSIVVRKGAILHIGDNTGISNSAIYCRKKIIIGNNVLIGGDCKIYDSDFHSIELNKRITTKDEGRSKSVIICNGVFIGASSIILKGTIIGDNSVIGAGSVVCCNIPKNEIWAGNPAKFIKKI